MQPAMHPRFLDTRDEKEEAIDDRLAEIASANKKYHEQEAEEKGASEDAAGSLHDEEPVDPLPFWGALESLDTVGSHLATLSNHQHSLATS